MVGEKYIKFVVLSAAAIIICIYFGSSLDWSEVGRSLQRTNKGLIAISVAIICFGYVLRSLRWQTLLLPITQTSFRELFATTTVGFAAVFIFGRMGEIVRPLWLPMRDPRVRPSAALVTIGLERFFDLAAIILLFALNLLWLKTPPGHEADYTPVHRIGLLMLLGTISGFALLLLFQYFAERITAWIDLKLLSNRYVAPRLRLTAMNLLLNFSASLQILRNRRELLKVIFWTGLLWFAISIPTWLVILAFNLPFGFSDALFVMGWAVVGSLMPTPGGAAGAFHTTTAAALIFLQVSREDAAAVDIVMHLVYFAPALFFGGYYFLAGDLSWRQILKMFGAEQQSSKEIRQLPQMNIESPRNPELLGYE